MYSYLADNNSEHKKIKDVNENAVATISYNEYKDVFFFCGQNSFFVKHVKFVERKLL